MARKEIRTIEGKEYQYGGTSRHKEQAEEIAREWRDHGFTTRTLKRKIGDLTVYDVYVCFE